MAERVGALGAGHAISLTGRRLGSGVSCDICIGNSLGVRNTLLLSTYAAVDERVPQLVRVVKYWAKRREINNTYYGTLSSYAYTLMVIFFMQTRREPLLPVLQQLPQTAGAPLPSVTVDGFETYFLPDLQAIRQQTRPGGGTARDGVSLSTLLCSFFRYYGHEFDYQTSVVCVRYGRVLRKTEKNWTQVRACVRA